MFDVKTPSAHALLSATALLARVNAVFDVSAEDHPIVQDHTDLIFWYLDSVRTSLSISLDMRHGDLLNGILCERAEIEDVLEWWGSYENRC